MKLPLWLEAFDLDYTCQVVRFTDHLGHLTVTDPIGRILLSEQVSLPSADLLVGDEHKGVWRSMCQMSVEFYQMDLLEGSG